MKKHAKQTKFCYGIVKFYWPFNFKGCFDIFHLDNQFDIICSIFILSSKKYMWTLLSKKRHNFKMFKNTFCFPWSLSRFQLNRSWLVTWINDKLNIYSELFIDFLINEKIEIADFIMLSRQIAVIEISMLKSSLHPLIFAVVSLFLGQKKAWYLQQLKFYYVSFQIKRLKEFRKGSTRNNGNENECCGL